MSALSIIQKLQDAAEREAQGDQKAHLELIDGIQALQNAVLTPDEKILRIRFQIYQNVCLRLAQEYGVLRELAENGRMSAEQLGTATNTDPTLIVRILRLLTIIGILDEVGPSLYEPNEMTGFCAHKGALGDIKFYTDLVMKVCSEIGPLGREVLHADPFEHTFGKNLYQYLGENREYGQAFQDFMTARRTASWDNWFDVYPVKEKIDSSQMGFDVLFVDVGGGQGTQTKKFRDAFPDLKGRLIVQDRPNVTPAMDGIEAMTYDFYTPQPIHGARIYYFKSILHNWGDGQGLQILKNTVGAMEKGRSTLLIDNLVLPEEKVPLRAAYLDIAMLALFSEGIQRTQSQWRTLIESAGLQLVKIWYPSSGNEEGEAILECEKI